MHKLLVIGLNSARWACYTGSETAIEAARDALFAAGHPFAYVRIAPSGMWYNVVILAPEHDTRMEVAYNRLARLLPKCPGSAL